MILLPADYDLPRTPPDMDWWTPADDIVLEQERLADAGYFDFDNEDDAPECEHKAFSEEAGLPSRSGACRVYIVCEDCGAAGRQVGWDSVL